MSSSYLLGFDTSNDLRWTDDSWSQTVESNLSVSVILELRCIAILKPDYWYTNVLENENYILVVEDSTYYVILLQKPI